MIISGKPPVWTCIIPLCPAFGPGPKGRKLILWDAFTLIRTCILCVLHYALMSCIVPFASCIVPGTKKDTKSFCRTRGLSPGRKVFASCIMPFTSCIMPGTQRTQRHIAGHTDFLQNINCVLHYALMSCTMPRTYLRCRNYSNSKYFHTSFFGIKFRPKLTYCTSMYHQRKEQGGKNLFTSLEGSLPLLLCAGPKW